MKEILDMLPQPIKDCVMSIPPSDREKIEEVRVRVERPLEIIVNGKAIFPSLSGRLPYIISHEDGVHLLNKLTDYSLYALEEELKKGFITVQGGHRVGLAGKVITEKGHVKMVRDITSFNIRIARQKIGTAEPLLPYLYRGDWVNTLIVGAPQTGKTTIIRDLARIISYGNPERGLDSRKVGIVDERSEIAGCVKGIPQHDVGPRTDVLDGCPKAEGMMMLIRSMSPDLLIADEIGRVEDTEALMEAVHAGVKFMITVHGSNLEDIRNRPSIRPLMEMAAFDRVIEISRRSGPGTIQNIYDRTGKSLLQQKSVVT